MTTIDRPVLAFSGEVGFTAAARRLLRASVVSSGPRFRIFRELRCAPHLSALKHARLSGLLRCHWHILRTHSSYSRV